MGKIVLILGGARSGKSTYALELAKRHQRVALVATCQGLDKEMVERIRKHRLLRPKHWKTFEEPKDLAPLLQKVGDGFDCILIDCLTLLVSNLILSRHNEEAILKKIAVLLRTLKKKKAQVIMVSNEVGLGLVPTYKLGRAFRDIAGKVNQVVAREASEVFFIISGIPVTIKGGENEQRKKR